jgi:hypothetical protein
MRIPVVTGIIDRRILVNYRVDPAVMAGVLPAPFRPQLVDGVAIGGICLIRLKHVRPRFLPVPWGVGSENAAHRIAVEWDMDGVTRQGVYIPRRDTNSRLNSLTGGRVFPGLHHHATFEVSETPNRFQVAMRSDDASCSMDICGTRSEALSSGSVFPSLTAASRFFEAGSLGYSATHREGRFDGLELRCQQWDVAPLDVESVSSSYFDDESRFPAGTVTFDCALLMHGIPHEWHGRDDLCCAAPAVV